MKENDEPCIELNEIFYYISGEFWKQAYNGLLRMQKKYESDQKISADSSIPINLLNNFHDKVAAEETFLRHSEEANPSECFLL